MYSHLYFSWGADQRLKISEIRMAILLPYSTSIKTSGKKSLLRPENGGHYDFFKILTHFQFDLSDVKRLSHIMPKIIFHGDDVIDDVTGSLKFSLYIHVQEGLAPGASCKRNVSSTNANIVSVFLG